MSAPHRANPRLPWRLLSAGTLFVLATGGCLAPAPAAALPPLSISNGTTLTVTLMVNGALQATVPPGVQLDPVPPLGLPPLPWAVEARSPSGRILVSMTVRPGDVRVTQRTGDTSSEQGDAARVDLSCGRLDIWSGPPLLGPAPGPGTPGDCVP